MSWSVSLWNEWPQRALRQQEAALDQLVGALEAAVLVLDDAVAVVADSVEIGEDLAPVGVAQAGQARDLPAHARRHRPALVQPVTVDEHVLRLEVEDVRAELADEAALVDHQPNEVRRVVVEPDRAAPLFDDPTPDVRRPSDVV